MLGNRQLNRELLIAVLGVLGTMAFVTRPGTAQAQPGRILSTTTLDIFECNIDGSNCFTVAGHGDNGVSGQPSVASGGAVAFQGLFAADPFYDGNPHIFLMNADGTNPRQITHNPPGPPAGYKGEQWPTISPDGSMVAFLATINTAPDGSHNQEIYVVNADGSNLRQLTPFMVYNNTDYSQSGMYGLAWSPDSTRVAFRGTVISSQCGTYFGAAISVAVIGTINADGSNMQVLACDNNDGYVSSIDWSPDGSLLAWGRNVSHCAQGGSGCAGEPAMEFHDFTGNNRYSAGITSAQLGTDSCQAGPHCIHFSPDSSRLAYRDAYPGGPGANPCSPCLVSLINLDGSNPTSTTMQNYSGLWWMAGAAVPTPSQLTLAGSAPNTPNTVEVWPGFPQQLVPTLDDPSLNLIFHSAGTYSIGQGQPGLNNCLNIGPYGLAFYVNEGGSGYNEYDGVTAGNAGLTSNPITVKCWPSSPCTFSLGSTNTSMAASGGTGTVSVIANPGTNQSTCPWIATTSVSWITITSGSSGSGSGSVSFSVAANSGAARQGTITIAGLTYTVNQDAAGSTASLQSIAVTPNPASVAAGLTVQFTATGSYSDGSTKNLTASVTWSSMNASIATINASGLAAGVAQGGPVNITAAFNGVSGTALLTVTAPVVQSISVSPTSASIAAGYTQQFTATGHYSDGSMQTLTNSVTWLSSNTSVASISSGGLAKGLAAGGPVTITAALNSVSGTASLTVTAAILTSIAVTPANTSVPAGGTQQFTATGTYSDGSAQTLTGVAWSSSNTAVATISASGLASALSAGSATISGTASGITGSTMMTVITLRSMTVTPANPSIFVGSTQQFTVTGTYNDGSTRDLTSTVAWMSSDTTVASITSPGGLATGVAKGTATITATSGNVSSATTLTVNAVVLQSITVSPATATVAVGGTQQFTATGYYNNGSTQILTTTAKWSTSSKKLASVNGTGLATGLAPGSATISASMGGPKGSVTGSAMLTVQ